MTEKPLIPPSASPIKKWAYDFLDACIAKKYDLHDPVYHNRAVAHIVESINIGWQTAEAWVAEYLKVQDSKKAERA